MWLRYMDGLSIRDIARADGIGIRTAQRHIAAELNQLPDNSWLSTRYCNRWSGFLVLDGTYIPVKGYKRKIPFVYALDYATHDIVAGVLLPSENKEGFAKLFRLIKTASYPLQVVICDDVIEKLIAAMKRQYPQGVIQLCHNHYLETIREKIHFRSSNRHHHFFHSLKKHVFIDPAIIDDASARQEKRDAGFYHVLTTRATGNDLREEILMNTARIQSYLFRYEYYDHCPHNTNLIEGYNEQLKQRTDAMKSFQSFQSASRFLNAWMIYRRTKPFTDCKKPFKHLNGHSSFELSIKKQAKWPDIAAVVDPRKPERKP